jgi:predicted Mrr-cat superfamily restriction endonuclease
MPEQDCSKHVKRIVIKLDANKLEAKRKSGLIAALLRVIAEYTNGFCAVEHADDADIVSSDGMHFWFTTEEKRAEFEKRIGFYLDADIVAALSASH